MTKKEKFELLEKVNENTLELSLLPKVIQTLIDDLSLDKADMTKDEMLNVGLGSAKIYSVLALTQLTIDKTLDAIDKLYKEEV